MASRPDAIRSAVSTFRLTFVSTTASGYPDAVRQAQSCESYEAQQHGKATVHTCALSDFTEVPLRRFLALWQAVQRWAGARLELDGEHLSGAERFAIGQILECMTRAVGRRPSGVPVFTPPQRYCQSTRASAVVATVSSSRPLPMIPCRLWAGQWSRDVDWDDLVGRDDQIRASLSERGVTRCPFLSLEPWDRSAMKPPTRVNNVVEFRPRGDGIESGA